MPGAGVTMTETVFDPAAGSNGMGTGKIKLAGSHPPRSFSPGAVRPERIGTLKKFVKYLQANGLVGKDESLRSVDAHRTIQKYAYLAKAVGMRLGYDFDFLESGAFSTEMSLDLYRLELAEGGAEPFGGDARASEAFLRLVRGRGKMWLRVATFAVETMDTIRDVDEFVAYVERESSSYDKRTARSAFESVRSLAGDGRHELQ